MSAADFPCSADYPALWGLAGLGCAALGIILGVAIARAAAWVHDALEPPDEYLPPPPC